MFNYEEIFIRNHIDGKGFLSLIETDLERMGITSRGHQKTILNLVMLQTLHRVNYSIKRLTFRIFNNPNT